jgi:PAS domain S-box-containing protein
MSVPNSPVVGKVDELLKEQIEQHPSPALEEIRSLVHELELRQADLEVRNEDLRKRQKQLEAYRDRYIDLYDSAPLGYATLDGDGFIQEINLAGAEMLGRARDSLIGYALGEYVLAEDQTAFLAHVRNCVSQRSEVTSELRLAARDGRSIPAQLRSIPIAGPNDDILCKTAIVDISQCKEMEERIRRSQDFLQTVIDAFPDIMLVIDRDYRILLSNSAARRLAGGVDPAACMTCHKLSHRLDLPCEGTSEPCPLRSVFASKSPMTVIHTHFDARGNPVYVELNAAPIFDEAGEVRGIIEVCRDITERKRAEEALAHEHNLLRTLIDNLPDCIYVKDSQSRFMAANLATARIMGAASPDVLVGKNDFDFYPQHLAQEYFKDEQEMMHSGQPLVNKDEPHVDPEGNRRTVFTTKIPLKDGQGAVVGMVGISRDITERIRAEESLRRAQQQIAEHQTKLREQVEAELVKVQDQLVRQAKLAAIGQVAASIVHDLRNPLMVARATINQLKRDLPSDIDPEIQRIDLIDRELETIKRIIYNLTELARAKQPRKEAVNLGKTVLEAFDRLDHDETITCEVQCEPQPLWVAADAVQMRQLLGNLLDNAIAAMPRGGAIRVFGRRDGGMDEIIVEDEGPGVPLDLRDRIFEPLFTTRPKGTGLGLPICRQIVEGHGGTMALLAKKPPGTSFLIRLPHENAI